MYYKFTTTKQLTILYFQKYDVNMLRFTQVSLLLGDIIGYYFTYYHLQLSMSSFTFRLAYYYKPRSLVYFSGNKKQKYLDSLISIQVNINQAFVEAPLEAQSNTSVVHLSSIKHQCSIRCFIGVSRIEFHIGNPAGIIQTRLHLQTKNLKCFHVFC